MKKNIPRVTSTLHSYIFHKMTFVKNVANVDDVECNAVVWKDNKPVTLLSTYTPSPVDNISKYDKATKRRVLIDCPAIIEDDNCYMGGVDLLDSFIGRYYISIKSKKWANRSCWSWLLYKNVLNKGEIYACSDRS